MIEECISLETTALQSQENDMIYTLLASIAEAINTLEGLKTDIHQKVISLIYLDPTFISYTTSTSRDSFISSYCAHHNLDSIPAPTIHPLSSSHTSANERDTELLLHTKSLQRHENNGLQTFRKAIEGIVIMPAMSYEKQVEDNNREIILKKLSNEIILGKSTESTAMELDAEGGASFEQLQDLIKKECDKRDKRYRQLEQKYNKLQDSHNQAQQKNMTTRGRGGASNKKKLSPTPTRKAQQKRGRSIPKRRPLPQGSRQTNQQKGKADDTSNVVSNESEKTQRNAGAHDRHRRKNFLHRSEQAATTVRNKIKQQFGFVADHTKTLLHNASCILAHTPTWYYFSRPSHLAFHDFTRSKQPAKNLRSLLGLGLKFIPTPRYTNTWKKLKDASMPNFTRAIHLRFHFAGTNTNQDETYDPKIYVRSKWTPPIGPYHRS